METTPPVLQEDQTLPEAPEATVEEPVKAAQEPKEPEAPPEEADNPRWLLEWFDERWGQRQGEKYKDDEAFLAAYDSLIRKSGQRDEDAVLGKKIRDRLAGDQLDTLLSEGKLPQSPKEKKVVPAFNPAWVTTDEKGTMVPAPGAPKDVVDRYQEMQQRLLQIAADPEKFFSPIMEGRFKELEKANQTLKQEMQQEKEDMEIAVWLKQNANAMYVDGDEEKGWSSQGEKILAWVRDPDNAAETPRVLARLKYAAKLAAPETRKTPRLKPPNWAKRKADVATKSSKPKSLEERFRDGEKLSTVLAEQAGVE